ncbi:hypothetical protein M4V62_40180 [Streptomyces durmitorensis]|uniref:Uncharacterized protein n=1 Tax=Streptomyces durmitorensis TaxID=319947 RepID=A0ABY4Q4Y6_9ACTN|nr:HAD family hydrolase [Streptomyces durmitorensis]UQT60791.1 hypothetical protein M4V62_40180 [Streptomyces durmitorensis]
MLTTRMRMNGQAFERSEGLKPGEYFAALNTNPEGIAVYAALEVGEATQEDWNGVIGGILGIDPSNLMQCALANLHPEPEIVAAARRAREAGVKVAMLSNSFGIEPYNPYADKGMWTDFFDAVILSELEGVRKPSPVIYERALRLKGTICTTGGVRPALCVGDFNSIWIRAPSRHRWEVDLSESIDKRSFSVIAGKDDYQLTVSWDATLKKVSGLGLSPCARFPDRAQEESRRRPPVAFRWRGVAGRGEVRPVEERNVFHACSEHRRVSRHGVGVGGRPRSRAEEARTAEELPRAGAR